MIYVRVYGTNESKRRIVVEGPGLIKDYMNVEHWAWPKPGVFVFETGEGGCVELYCDMIEFDKKPIKPMRKDGPDYEIEEGERCRERSTSRS